MIKLLKQMERKDVRLWLLACVLVLGDVYFSMALPKYMGSLIEMITQETCGTASLWATGLRMLLCAIGSAGLMILVSLLSERTATGFALTLRRNLYHHINSFSKAEMNRFSIPSLIVRTTSDVTQLQDFASIIPGSMIKGPVMVIWAVSRILTQSLTLSMVTGACMVLILAIMFSVLFILLPSFSRLQKLNDRLNQVTRESISGIQVIHAFNAEDYQEQKFDQVNQQMQKTEGFNQRLFCMLIPVVTTIISIMAVAIYYVGASVINGIDPAALAERSAMLGNITAFILYANYVMGALIQIVMVIINVPYAKISAQRINEVLETVFSVKPGNQTPSQKGGLVEFRNVSFRFPGGAADVLHDISFTVKPGETLAIIGSTGSGKTTLVSLLTRMYDVTGGQVLLDGTDIRELSFETLYSRIGIATQKATLFTGTVDQNVNLGRNDLLHRDEDTWEALEIAQAKDFVYSDENGLGKSIAQGGQNVSGGQKQRLSVARLLARKPEVMIFDDTFSALDFRTDTALRRALREKRSGTTLIIVAQRISTIRHADTIIVLDKGAVAGSGTHEELLKSCPVYQEIAAGQQSLNQSSGRPGKGDDGSARQ